MKSYFTLLLLMLGITAQAQFTTGNIVVARIGDGAATLGSTSAAVSLVEFAAVGASGIPVSTSTLGATTQGSRLTISGTTASEGQISLSQNGSYLNVLGYDQPVGTDQTTIRNGKKVIARFSTSGVEYNAFDYGSGGATRNAVTTDGSLYYLKVSNVTVGAYTWGTPAVPPATTDFATVNTVRSLLVSGNQLYEITSASNLSYSNPALPTGALTTSAAVFNPNVSASGFVFFDLDATVGWNGTGYDVVYIGGLASGLEKWYFNGTSWIAANAGSTAPTQALFPSSAAVGGITGTLINNVPTIYGVGGNGSAIGNNILRISDNSGRTGTMTLGGTGTAVATVIGNAGSNYAFRGCAFAPGTQVVLRATPIPVELMSFKGSLIQDKAALQWATASERNAKEFIVEKSTDAKEFAAIGTVAAKNTSNITNYSFDDAKLSENVNYYRLKMVDTDGSFKYSNVVALRLGSKSSKGISVFPNPVANNMTINHTEATEGATISIVSINGSTVAQYNVAKNAIQTSLDVTQLVAGQYFIKFTDKGKSITTAFIK